MFGSANGRQASRGSSHKTGRLRLRSRGDPKLNLFGFFSITAIMVISVHEYPTFAVAGMQIPFFLILVGLLWFLPVALCSAEMATVKGWEEDGIFSWVGNILGERFGFAAAFLQWFQITVCFITSIYFMLGAFSYLFGIPALDNNPIVKCLCTIAIFWILSLTQLAGLRRTARFARVGFILGVAIPTIFLLTMGIFYIVEGKPLQFSTEPMTLFPDFAQVSTLVVLISFLFANMGAEASASHINEMKNPKRDYPIAMLLLVAIATLLNAMGGFAVAGIVPLQDLSMSAGVVQAIEGMVLSFDQGFVWVVKLMCALLAIGVIGELSSWIIGPSRAMYAAVERGLLPKHIRGLNKQGVPVRIIVIQGIVVSIWAVVLTIGGGGENVSYLAALSLTALIYLAAYVMMFVSYLLLIRRPGLERGFHVPGGKLGKVLCAGAGLLMSVFAIIIAFFPPIIVDTAQIPVYETILFVGFAVTLALPFAIYSLYGKNHEDNPDRDSAKPIHVRAKDAKRFTRLSARGEHLILPEKDRG